MATVDDARDAVLEDLQSGVQEKQMSDRRIKNMDVDKRLDALNRIEADQNQEYVKINFGFSR